MFHICLWQDTEHELQISGISGIVAWESKLPYSPLLVKCIPIYRRQLQRSLIGYTNFYELLHAGEAMHSVPGYPLNMKTAPLFINRGSEAFGLVAEHHVLEELIQCLVFRGKWYYHMIQVDRLTSRSGTLYFLIIQSFTRALHSQNLPNSDGRMY